MPGPEGATHNGSLWPSTAANAFRTQRGGCRPVWEASRSRSGALRGQHTLGILPRVHTPAASRSLLSTRSVRRQSRPWAPATPRSSSLSGIGSSESQCSTWQLKTKERPLRSRGAPRGPQAPKGLPGLRLPFKEPSAHSGLGLPAGRGESGSGVWRPQNCLQRVAEGKGLSQSRGHRGLTRA